jgi:hypothetical protein
MLSNTPIEKYIINGRDIYVKREDMCCSLPSFSKLRSVEAHLKSRSEKTIGVLNTFHIKAGWVTASQRARFQNLSIKDYFKMMWNDPNQGYSPYKYFYGLLKPLKLDNDKNIIYQYVPYS